MATKEVTLTGVSKWSHKLFQPESYNQGPARYSTRLYLDAANKAIFQSLRLKNKIKEDEDGEYVTLRRDHDPKEFKGKVIYKGGPPKIYDAEGNRWPEDTMIGNGSVLSVKLSVYNTKMGPASRVEKVRVDELVEYNKPDVDEDAVPF